ncbi:MAG: NAD(P)H-dependent oxidoreductase [Candidatus Thermoplasmatota archaeon]|nr:NAD(P)H-dependent oxidoreductase [Candidatus Thermoplasmatota archaeon]
MKICIIYYSRTGNTRSIAKLLEKQLSDKNADVDLLEVKAVKNPGFFKACISAIKERELPIKNTKYDLKKFDTILFGCPVWAGSPSPYIKSFLEKAQNSKGKNAGIFVTCRRETIKQSKAGIMVKNELKKHDMKPINELLALKMKKEKIVDGEQNIDSFIKTVMK